MAKKANGRSGSFMRAKTFLAALILFSFAAALTAHPHMSLESSLEFELKGKECVGIRAEWVFDSVFSANIIGQFDSNRDGKFSPAENEAVRKGAFSNLFNYGYFFLLMKGGSRVSPKKVEAFEASQREGTLVYRFRVPLEGLGYAEDFYVAVFDTTFFCDVRYAEVPATATATAAAGGTEVAEAGGADPRPAPRFEVAINKKYPA
jgi:ABC-type uncharacterized transport system substrate-binding protein